MSSRDSGDGVGSNLRQRLRDGRRLSGDVTQVLRQQLRMDLSTSASDVRR